MKAALGWLLLIPLLAIRFLLALIGLVVVPFTDRLTNPIYGNREDPCPRIWFRPDDPFWLRDYMWRAIRNPTNNLRYLFEAPPYDYKGTYNCDHAVRQDGELSAWRLVHEGIYVEYWYLRRLKDGGLFEFRVGWKFSGVPGFAPTIQLRREAP